MGCPPKQYQSSNNNKKFTKLIKFRTYKISNLRKPKKKQKRDEWLNKADILPLNLRTVLAVSSAVGLVKEYLQVIALLASEYVLPDIVSLSDLNNRQIYDNVKCDQVVLRT